MKRYSFGTFLVDDSNRDAFAIAQRVAEFKVSGPQPILLVGDAGCGKTHLLYAIVNRVRASTERVGLALITAKQFPDEARLLIDDPSRVERQSAAILLVDQIDQFTNLVEELEAVVRIFLDNGHTVVLASARHPGRLSNLPDSFQALIKRGQIVDILPQTPETRIELRKREAGLESAAVIERQQREIDELRALVERLGRDASTRGDEVLRQELESERRQRTEAERRLADLRSSGATIQDDLAAAREQLSRLQGPGSDAAEAARLRRELENAQREAENLRAQAGELAGAGRELERLKQRMAELGAERQALAAMEEERKELDREVCTLQDQLREAWAKSARLSAVEDECDELRRQVNSLDRELEGKRAIEAASARLERELETARREHEEARTEANRLLQRAESLLELVETNRTRFREVEEQRQQQIEQLETTLARQRMTGVSREELEEVKAQAETALEQLARERGEFDRKRTAFEDDLGKLKEENAGLRQELLQANSQCEDLRGALYGLQSERDELEKKLESTSRHTTLLASELDALRQEAAAQVAEANAQAGELEGRLSRLQTDLEARRSVDREAQGDLEAIVKQLQGLMSSASRVTQQLATDSVRRASAAHTEDVPVEVLQAMVAAAGDPSAALSGDEPIESVVVGFDAVGDLAQDLGTPLETVAEHGTPPPEDESLESIVEAVARAYAGEPQQPNVNAFDFDMPDESGMQEAASAPPVAEGFDLDAPETLVSDEPDLAQEAAEADAAASPNGGNGAGAAKPRHDEVDFSPSFIRPLEDLTPLEDEHDVSI